MSAAAASAQQLRQQATSPFRQSEWDSRLDHLLADLENSATTCSTNNIQRSASSERKYTANTYASVSASAGAASNSNILSKSKSTSSLTGAETGNMLKDLDTALKASTNYIESHRTEQLPNGTREFHEYRSSTTSGGPRTDDFNLERQVQHMMPSNSGMSSYSGLQSANMVSSVQQSSSSYTSYKVQSNSYSSAGSRIDYDSSNAGQQHASERPGSRLKANIDELDTLLSDLNNAQTTRSNHETSSEDYGDHHLQGHVKKTISSMNDYTSMQQSSSNEYNRKPPSPSPRRRTPVSCSPAPPRRTSPSPVNNRPTYRSASPPRKRSPSPIKIESYNQSGQGYYSKYSNNSYTQNTSTGPPASFPTCPSPSPALKSLQTPPKRVDDLMSELSEFDPSIQHTSFAEPSVVSKSKYTFDEEDSRIQHSSRREPSPIKPAVSNVKQPSTPGPAVYYPPGELFSSTRMTSDTPPDTMANTTMDTSASSRNRAKVRAEYGYKSKGRYSEETGESKQGAAVVPICLPLCCAAPCVIL